jgi:DNA-binding NtrC family response regulator
MSVESGSDRRAPTSLRESTESPEFVRLNLIGESPVFLEAVRLIRRLSSFDAAVLIQGETGTGKELAARAIHYLGARRNAPFIPVNCGAIPDNLVESEFFGHERGAFTDAKETRQGVIEQAERGTLFLDELEVLSPRGQVALLRFLQDHSYRSLGSVRNRVANVRVVGSSNTDLGAAVKRGEFRADLLFRLSVLTITLPPIRERTGDAVLLAERFIRRFSAEYGLAPRPLDERAREYLERYDWPGNVRELENLVHRAILLDEGPYVSFAEACGDATATHLPSDTASIDLPFNEAKARAIAIFERTYVTELLRRTHGNISQAARLCGKERSRLGKLIKKYGLERVAVAPAPEKA